MTEQSIYTSMQELSDIKDKQIALLKEGTRLRDEMIAILREHRDLLQRQLGRSK